jgi:NADP+-dependent farnesol dehydrogenase
MNSLAMEKWKGKFAVVTGASSGIGKAITLSLIANDINVIGLARRAEKIEEISNSLESYRAKLYARHCDISDLNSIGQTFKWIEQQFDSISILVNNAGTDCEMSVFDESAGAADKISSVISTNFAGLVHCSREAVRLMRKSSDHGLLVNIGNSTSNGIPFFDDVQSNVYIPSKAAVNAFSEIARQELISTNCERIRVTNLCPGYVQNPERLEEDYFDQNEPHLEPKDIADGVIYVLSTPSNVNVTEITIKPVGEKF